MKEPNIMNMDADKYRHAMAAYSVKKRMGFMNNLMIITGAVWIAVVLGTIWAVTQKEYMFALGEVVSAGLFSVGTVLAYHILSYMNVMTMMMYKDIEGKELDIMDAGDEGREGYAEEDLPLQSEGGRRP